MQDLNIFRIVGRIKNLIIQKEHPTTPMQFDLLTVDGAFFKIHVGKDIYDSNTSLDGLNFALVECLGCFEMIENSVTLSLKNIFHIELTKCAKPF